MIHIGPLHVLWQVSFSCWVTWSISSWKKYYKSVFFPKDKWFVAELIFLSLNNSGLNFLQNEFTKSSQIYPSPEKLRNMFTFQSCKFLNDKIEQNNHSPNCQVPNILFWYNCKFHYSKTALGKENTPIILLSAWDRSRDSTAKKKLSKDM